MYKFDISADISAKLINDCLNEPDIIHVLATNELVSYTNKTNPDDKRISHYQNFDFLSDNTISYLKISVISSNNELVEKIVATYSMLDYVIRERIFIDLLILML